MAKVLTDDKHYKTIAEAIRDLDPSSETGLLKPSEMANKLNDNVSLAISHTHTQAFDDGWQTGYSDGWNDCDSQGGGYDAGYEDGYNSALGDSSLWQEHYDKGLSDGKQEEYDRFWNTYQQNGNRTNYRYAFAGDAWGAKGLLPPKYPIVLAASRTGQEGMFESFNVYAEDKYTNPYDMTELCSMIDFSACTYVPKLFENAVCKNITCDFSNLIEMSYTFAGGNGGVLNNITLTVTDKLTSAVNPFINQTFLKSVTFTEDSVIACNGFNFQWSPLNKASFESVINALSSTTTGKTITFQKAAKETAFTQDEWDALIATKPNWTISLV